MELPVLHGAVYAIRHGRRQVLTAHTSTRPVLLLVYLGVPPPSNLARQPLLVTGIEPCSCVFTVNDMFWNAPWNPTEAAEACRQ